MSTLPEINAYAAGVDAAAFLRSIPPGAASAVVTSPPYNRRQDGRPSAGHARMRALTKQGYAGHDDAMEWQGYIDWQRDVLAAALSIVGGADGAGIICYQHAPTVYQGREQQHAAAILDGFPVRQTIIWDKAGACANAGGACPQRVRASHELVTVIAGRRYAIPARSRHSRYVTGGSVWRIPPEAPGQRPAHPAPFPVALATAMLTLCPDEGAVVDPFAGSGTVGIAAHRIGLPFYLGDLSTEYQAIFAARYAAETAQARLA